MRAFGGKDDYDDLIKILSISVSFLTSFQKIGIITGKIDFRL